MKDTQHNVVSWTLGLLKEHEGFSHKVYKDSVGVATIGYGFALRDVSTFALMHQFYLKEPGCKNERPTDEAERTFFTKCFGYRVPDTLTDEEYEWCAKRFFCSKMNADDILQRKLDEFLKELLTAYPWMSDVDTARRSALLNMVYNLGLPRFSAFKKTIALLKEGRYEAAAVEMMDSMWAKQVGHRSFDLALIVATGSLAVGHDTTPLVHRLKLLIIREYERLTGDTAPIITGEQVNGQRAPF